jgi:hypothetical protein
VPLLGRNRDKMEYIGFYRAGYLFALDFLAKLHGKVGPLCGDVADSFQESAQLIPLIDCPDGKLPCAVFEQFIRHLLPVDGFRLII